MSTYIYRGMGYGLPMEPSGIVTLKRRVDIPAIIAGSTKGGLALAATPNDGVAVPAAGFTAADVIKVFGIPSGTIIRGVGIYVVTGEGATCTINVGVQTSAQTSPAGAAAGFGVFNIETAAALDATTDGTDAYGLDTAPAGALFITDGTIDIYFNHSTVNLAVFDIWAFGFVAR